MRRLQTQAQFKAVLAAAIVAKTARFALHRMECAADQAVSIGVVIPKRWAKRAPTRNLIRRQIYVVASRFLSQASPAAFVVRLRCQFSSADFTSASSERLKKAVRDELVTLMRS